MKLAHALRAEIEQVKANKKKTSTERLYKSVIEKIMENKIKGEITVQSLSSEVVKRLEEEGFTVTFQRACGMGDVDSHRIKW